MKQTTLPESVRTFKLGIYTSDITQPISLMRVMGPFATMAKEDRRLELVQPPVELLTDEGMRLANRLNWDWLIQCDAVFLLHPETDVHVHCAALAYQLGIPIWAEFVDDCFNVDAANPAIQFHRNKRLLRENVASICKWASVVTCVSEYNRKAMLDGLQDSDLDEGKFLVIPEGAMWPQWNLKRNKLISWRGLGSHGGDVAEALPHILRVAREFPDWSWLFGGDQEILQSLGEQLTPIVGKKNVWLMPYWPTPFEAMQAWGHRAPYLHIVPLADTAFNRSKSHLAWLEASAVGAAVIVPAHLPEWQQPGTIPYRHGNVSLNGEEDLLGDVIAREVRQYNEGLFHPQVEISRQAIWPAKTLPAMNRRRWAILNKLAQAGIEEAA